MDSEQTVRRVLSVFHTFEEADHDVRRTFWSWTPEERLRHVERLRRLNYGEAYVHCRALDCATPRKSTLCFSEMPGKSNLPGIYEKQS